MISRLLYMVLLMGALAAPTWAQSNIPTDYAAIIGSTAGTVSDGYGSPGSVPVHGRASFPVLIDANNVPAVSAGRYNDGIATNAARAVCASHTGFLNTSGTTTTSTLFLNSVLWASRKTTPSTITVGCGPGVSTSFFTSRGYLTKSVTTTMSSSSNDLTGCDVFVGSWHSGYSASAVTKIQAFAAAGGGLVTVCTPWALGTQAYNDAQAVLEPFGLSISGSGPETNTFTAAAVSYPVYHSALPALDMLLQEKQGQITMTLADKTIAAGAVDRTLAARPTQAEVNSQTTTLSNLYGYIQITAAQPLTKSQKPVEAMLARYQSNQFDALPPASLFVHPTAGDFPGLPAAGGTPISKTIAVNGNTPADFYMNQGSRPTRVETGLYCAPGTAVTITLPSDKTSAGLEVQIGANDDQFFGLSTWSRFPKVSRRQTLTQTSTQIGSVFGGLVILHVPAGSSLGNFNVTVANALEAPCFTLGQTTDANWNSTIRNAPGATGFLRCNSLVIYLPRWQLNQLSNPTQVATYWQTAMDAADEFMGYSGWRKRGEAIVTDIAAAAGAAYAGYPIHAGWGWNSEGELNNARLDGSWGDFHELGHGFQDDFDSAYVLPTHAEVDVNLVPAIVYSQVHNLTTWDYNSSFYGSSHRLTQRTNFLALTAAEQTWAAACDINSGHGAAYDFYYNLADAFGWQLYKTAFGRLMVYLQNPSGSTDTELVNLSSSDPNYKRNRFYLLFCEAAQRNLDTYFQRYGLGKVGAGYEITQSVKDLITSKGYPVWTDNSAVDSLSNPGTLTLAENTPVGTPLYTFAAVDAEEPGTVWTYSITAGNDEGAFSIDKRTGVLRISARGLDYERAASYNLTVTVQDNGIPRQSLSSSFTVNVSNVPDVPSVAANLFTAASTMNSGSVVGTATASVEPGRTISSWAIVAGNANNWFAIDASGQITVQQPGSLPGPGAVELVVRSTDSAGQVGYGSIKIICNATLGVKEERWTGTSVFWNGTWSDSAPSYTGALTDFTTPQNVANSYSRRVSGYIVPKVSGLYTFWIASDDDSRLYLSTDSTPANKVQIASVDGWTGYQSWDEKTSQKSASIPLWAGRAYYIEATQVEGSGGDHVAVAWQAPGGTRQTIPASALVPNQTGITFSSTSIPTPTLSITNPTNGTAFPAPANITINASVADNLNTVSSVRFYSGSTFIGEDFTSPYSTTWNSVPAGNYTLTAQVIYSGGTVNSSGVGVTVASTALPAPWQSQDVGSVGVSGNASHFLGTYTVAGSGADIWNTADAFRYVYQSLSGDGEIIARVTAVQNTNVWAKAGVMIRESLAAGSMHASIFITPGSGVSFQRRASTGGSSTSTTVASITAPRWVRIVRSSNTLTAYYSSDGTSWTQVGSQTISMASNIYIGLAVTSHNNSQLCSSTFDNVTVVP